MLLTSFVFIVGTICLGIIARKLKLVPANASDAINKYVLNIALPAIILLNVPKLESFNQLLIPVSVHWLGFGLMLALLYLLNKFLKLGREVLWTLIVTATLGNTAFLGIPMVETFYGQESVLTAILYDQLGSAFGFILIATILIPIYQKQSVGNLKKVAVDLIKFPPFVALVAGLLLRGVNYPTAIQNFLEQVGGTLIPMAMFTVGLNFSLRIPRENFAPIAIGLGLKLLVVPLVILSLFKAIGVEFTETLQVSIFQSGMPPMVTAGILAVSAGLNRLIAAALVGIGLVLSFASLTLLSYLI